MKKSNYRKMLQNGATKLSVFMFALAALFITGCEDEGSGELPTTSTGEVAELADIYAVINGSVTSDGGSNILAMGICWTTEDKEPTTTDNIVAVGTYTLNGILAEEWDYSVTLDGLSSKTDYKVRAYAANEAGTSYGETIAFTTKAGKTFHTLTADMIDTYTQEIWEGPKENLVDGDPSTFWHSAWSDEETAKVQPLPHHIQITFPEAKYIGGFQFWTRSTSARTIDPAQFDVQVSTDGVEYTTVWTSERFDAKARPDYNELSLDKNYSSKYFRIRILDTRTTGYSFTTMGEIKVFDDGLLDY
ncbi:discoidin domain-containing protein [Draconibacterium sp. IB214405]|uniref:discoidin domain-containing protein n=1 Tax=Draconibacterium sp. IB214405 TaxID=3097352 RepID=UPI002A17E361|nr:discoidin domain-containing protein [Draconibacterium sp. IB214405]MDX8340679.1 discoidin domain-containing protein [Draconibacterium sp. IB214405]